MLADMSEFMVMGAVKTGTTSLYHYLSQHPEIQMSRVNWPRFFHVDGSEPDFDRFKEIHGEALLNESLRRYRLMCHQGIPKDFDAYRGYWPDEGRQRIRGEEKVQTTKPQFGVAVKIVAGKNQGGVRIPQSAPIFRDHQAARYPAYDPNFRFLAHS